MKRRKKWKKEGKGMFEVSLGLVHWYCCHKLVFLYSLLLQCTPRSVSGPNEDKRERDRAGREWEVWKRRGLQIENMLMDKRLTRGR